MRTYWNTRKRDLLEMAQKDEALIEDKNKQLEKANNRYMYQYSANSVMGQLMRMITFDEYVIAQVDTEHGPITLFWPKSIEGIGMMAATVLDSDGIKIVANPE